MNNTYLITEDGWRLNTDYQATTIVVLWMIWNVGNPDYYITLLFLTFSLGWKGVKQYLITIGIKLRLDGF